MKACKFYLSGGCRYKNCKFYHPPPGEIEKYRAMEGFSTNYRDGGRTGRDDYNDRSRTNRNDYDDRSRTSRDDYGDGGRTSRDDYNDRSRIGRDNYRDGNRTNYRQRDNDRNRTDYRNDRTNYVQDSIPQREYAQQPSKPYRKRSSLYDPPRWIFSSYPGNTNLISASPDELRYRYMQLTPHEYLEEYRRAFVHNYEVLRGMVDELGSADSTSKRWVDLRRYVDVFDGHEIVFSSDGRHDNDRLDNGSYERHDRSVNDRHDRHDNSRSITDRYTNTHANTHTNPNPVINPINHNFIPPYNYETPHTIPSNTQPTIFNHPNHQTTNSLSNESKDTPKYAFGNIPYF